MESKKQEQEKKNDLAYQQKRRRTILANAENIAEVSSKDQLKVKLESWKN